MLRLHVPFLLTYGLLCCHSLLLHPFRPQLRLIRLAGVPDGADSSSVDSSPDTSSSSEGSPLTLDSSDGAAVDFADDDSSSVALEDFSPKDYSSDDSALLETAGEVLPPPAERRTPSVFSSQVSRRDWLQTGLYVTAGCALAADVVINNRASNTTFPTRGGQLNPVNLTKVVQETRVNISVSRVNSCVCLDHVTFQKKQYINLPSWVPQSLIPPPRVVKEIPDQELLVAAISAGTVVEMARTTLLYPLLTLKTRIQTDINTRQRKRKTRLRVKRRIKVIVLNAKRHFNEGSLYAGLLPSLLITAPATGIYYGVREVLKRELTPLQLSDLAVAIIATLVASVFSISIRTPVDAFSTRLQVATGIESHDEHEDEDESEREERINEQIGDWFTESLERLPILVLTDVPYLLLRVVLNGALIHGTLDFGRYEILAICSALFCGILTTPFDVARTRILMDSDDDPTNGIDGGSGEGLRRTFQTIIHESDDGVANLFRGWFERALYLGIGRAWLEPLQIVGYIALRDTILLEWFD